ncbi:hypothetical protein Taro_048883 [Colocasia esculenta]|uniref:Uncharacterized protein n=1 Tax=Colocasia esculenta TaxID=4460 RepID=A0A843X9D5_COLES|nr:hypothetical protein [Colocasia esculenta]
MSFSILQAEGAAAEDGRGPSIWDGFTHAGNMADGSTGDVTSDQYHKFPEDVKLMKETGLEAYRFSISWSRLIPEGRGDVNPRGLAYYNKLIDQLLMHGIQPHVTLYHLDLPQALEDEYHGWLSPRIVAFGSLLHDGGGVGVVGMTSGHMQMCASVSSGTECPIGPPSTSPTSCPWAPTTTGSCRRGGAPPRLGSSTARPATPRWNPTSPFTMPFSHTLRSRSCTGPNTKILNPLVYGDYPEDMKKMAGSRLPSFNENQSKQVKGSFDFLGLNHYSTLYVRNNPQSASMQLRDIGEDMAAVISVSKNDTSSGQVDETGLTFLDSVLISAFSLINNQQLTYALWEQSVPIWTPPDASGLQNVLEYITQVYEAPQIYVQENGYGDPYNSSLNDTVRRDALEGYIGAMLAAIRNGSRVRGYLVWSFMDVFEVLSGYTVRYGLYHVDFEDEQRIRRPKLSALWYKGFLAGKDTNTTVRVHLHGAPLASPSASHPSH